MIIQHAGVAMNSIYMRAFASASGLKEPKKPVVRRLCGAGLLLLIALAPAIHAQKKDYKLEAQKLRGALVALKKAPDDPAAQTRYLKLFPQTYTAFLGLFDQDRELNEGYYEYIEALSSLVKNHESEVGRLLVNLSKDAVHQEDAVSDLQQATTEYAGLYTQTFVRFLRQLTPRQSLNLISFLADREAIEGEPKYQLVIDNLRKLGEQKFAAEFESARKERARFTERH